ncbi:hypothetical protein IH992_35375, partial [Candidatus Poribacteria bacterium]|nr:hypothetical protein [Candidatus Poribacteria bacterium]
MRLMLSTLTILAILASGVYAELPKDIVFLMTFNEGKGDTAEDFSGNDNEGKVDGKTDWIKGKYNGAF